MVLKHHSDCACSTCYPVLAGKGYLFSKRLAFKQFGTWLMNLLGGA